MAHITRVWCLCADCVDFGLHCCKQNPPVQIPVVSKDTHYRHVGVNGCGPYFKGLNSCKWQDEVLGQDARMHYLPYEAELMKDARLSAATLSAEEQVAAAAAAAAVLAAAAAPLPQASPTAPTDGKPHKPGRALTTLSTYEWAFYYNDERDNYSHVCVWREPIVGVMSTGIRAECRADVSLHILLVVSCVLPPCTSNHCVA
jgi:hypothetical protein